MDPRICQAAITGRVELLHEAIKEDALILDKIAMGYYCINGSPLHVAASRGHTQFVKEVLQSAPELAEVLDSRQRSALHLAAAKGHLDVVKALVEVSPEMCLARDRDGRNPHHVAAANGRVEVLEELVRVSRCGARASVDRHETILHLCVKHNQFETLEFLVNVFTDHDFVNAKDSDGNTVLHIAVLDKQLAIIEHVLKNSKIDVNATNASDRTAMDILFLSQSGKGPEDLDHNIQDLLLEANAKRAKELVQGEWLAKKRDTLMIVASLMATMAFQAGVNPPGGVWQDNLNGHRAGEAVMAYNYYEKFPLFLRSNTIAFVASLSTILLLISGLPFKKRAFMWILVLIMWLTITSMAFTYAFSSIVITPRRLRPSVSHTIVVAVIVWCSVMASLLLVHSVRSIADLVGEELSKRRAIKRLKLAADKVLRGAQSIARPNVVTGRNTAQSIGRPNVVSRRNTII